MTATLDLAEDLGRFLVDQAADMLFLVDPVSLRVVLANSAASTRLGYAADQLTGMRIDELDCGQIGRASCRERV